MEHYYHTIQGAFTFPGLYSDMVNRFDNAEFVEVGADAGQSTAFMGVQLINANKNIKFHVVDSWAEDIYKWGTNEEKYQKFLKNLEPVSSILKEKFNVMRSLSVDASKTFKDESLDFVFIDCCHEYESVMEDLVAWFPKVKKGGIFAGHDYYDGHYGVEQAVNEFFYRKLPVKSGEFCWVVNKN